MLFGCVYNPYTREMYSAVKGEGAKLNGKEIHCSDKGLADNLVAFGTARYQTEDTDRIFDHAKKLYLNSLGIRAGGSAALDICRVASGANGVYLELMLYPWDYAATRLELNGRRWNDHAGSAVFDTGSKKTVLEGSKPVVECIIRRMK